MLLAVGAGQTDEEFLAPALLASNIIEQIAAPSKRDKQRLIGPSSLGDTCEYCVARYMAASLPGAAPVKERFSIPPWIGTAVHYWFEHHIDMGDGWHQELSLPVGEIPGYGEVIGHIDAYHEPSETVIDWKIVGDNAVKKLRAHGLPEVYEYQRNLYALAVRKAERPVEFVMNFYIPRNGNTVRDFIIEVDRFDPVMAQEALDRAEVIWHEWVLTGKWEELASDEDCYRCNRLSTPVIKELVRRGK